MGHVTKQLPHSKRTASWLISPNIALMEDTVSLKDTSFTQAHAPCKNNDQKTKGFFLRNTPVHLLSAFANHLLSLHIFYFLWLTEIPYTTTLGACHGILPSFIIILIMEAEQHVVNSWCSFHPSSVCLPASLHRKVSCGPLALYHYAMQIFFFGSNFFPINSFNGDPRFFKESSWVWNNWNQEWL